MTASHTPAEPGTTLLVRLERILGSSLLSLVCFMAVVLSLDLPFWLYLAIMVVFVNYSVKIDQLHREVAALAKAKEPST